MKIKTMSHLLKIFLIIGGLNLGLMGVGIFLGKDLNFINLLSAFNPSLPAIIYSIIGLSAIILIFKKS